MLSLADAAWLLRPACCGLSAEGRLLAAALGRYDLDLIVTAPSVVYTCELSNGEELRVDSPAKLPDADGRVRVLEPCTPAARRPQDARHFL